MIENEKFLTEQLITYIGNKRNLLDFINKNIIEIKQELNKDKLVLFDGFAGSGVVSRLFKQHASKLYSNDLEQYSHLVTKSYLTNENDIDKQTLSEITNFLNVNKFTTKYGKGIIEEYYSPKNTFDIKENERCFYTNENAKIIDNIRRLIDDNVTGIYRDLLLSNLIHKASVHTNTSGVFKGFYKSKNNGMGKFGGDGENALNRIMGEISLEYNVFSNFNTECVVFQDDTNNLIKKISNLDVVYYDPPYNQHPYGSNYHILNTILRYEEPKNISKISGIPNDWNKSEYNYKLRAEKSLDDLIKNTDSKYILLSYNNEGIIESDKIIEILSNYGEVKIEKQEYNTFRGSRNLKDRTIKVEEQIYVLKRV